MSKKVPKCCGKGEVVRNMANNKEFWYCRDCKKEVTESDPYEIKWEELQKRIDEALKANQVKLSSSSCPHLFTAFTPGIGNYCITCGQPC